jgi:hypothetical protein
LSPADDAVWCFHYSDPRQSARHRVRGWVAGAGWKLAEQYPYSFVLVPTAHFPYTLLPTHEPNQVSLCTLSHWKRDDSMASGPHTGTPPAR